MRAAAVLGALALLALALAGAWVRLSPSDPARLHLPLPTPPAALGTGTVLDVPGGAWLRLDLPLAPGAALARIDAVAVAGPRTRRLAGSPGEGRITWTSRSLVWGFPDETTAEARPAAGGGSQVILFARQRFGRSDFGVNAARLRDWQRRLGG